MPHPPPLFQSDCAVVKRQGRFLIANLIHPHRVFSTSHALGGQQEGLTYLANHQSCEGSGHLGREESLHKYSPQEYHAIACSDAGLPPESTALMGTAASMDYVALATESWEDLSVTALLTGGVRGNAARAGDPARWHESEGQWVAAQAKEVKTEGTEAHPALEPGTINAMMLFSRPLSSAAMMRAVISMTEAKAAVMQELAVPSLQSSETATGTGTDQFILAAPLALDGESEITWSGHHTKTGEITSRAMMRALRETLRWQNGLEPSLTRNLAWAGRSLGLTETVLREELPALLSPAGAELLQRNFEALMHHPRATAQIYALRSLEERARYGTLPASLLPELRLEQAILLTRYIAAISSDAGSQSHAQDIQWRSELAPLATQTKPLILKALALGLAAKWQ